MITTRTGETLIVKGAEGNTTVVLTDNTRTKDDRGLFGLDKQNMASTVLIPGTKVKVKGTADDQNRVIAKTITVDGDDLESAQMIQAGLHPTATQVAENVQTLEQHQGQLTGHAKDIAANKENIDTNARDIGANKMSLEDHSKRIDENMKDIAETTERFNSLADFDTKGEATVKFKSGSALVSAADKAQLKTLAETAKGNKGYIVEVTGYTDSQGGAAMNTALSEKRAKAVITYLVQQGGVPIRHIVAPGAMGEYGASAPNETKAGRAENRKVDVKVLVNKGIAGGSGN